MTRVENFLSEKWPNNEIAFNTANRLWKWYQSTGLADPHFESEFTSKNEEKFYQRLWEMMLAKHISNLGHNLLSSHAGPDFCFIHNGKKVWIEAICPSPSGIPKEYLEPSFGTVITLPHEQIVLRWTSALSEKRRAFKKYREIGIVGANDCQIIAINGCQLVNSPALDLFGISQLPWIVEATLPIGPQQMTVSQKTGEIIDSGFSYRKK